MREILFHGKRVDNGEWIEGYYVKAEKLNCGGYEHFIIEESANGATYEVIPETVGQYTELPDKNGKKIFEGDIVIDKYPNEKFGFAGYIRYNANKTDFEICNPKQPDLWVNLGSRKDSIKVIGNIHDNPELLDVNTNKR